MTMFFTDQLVKQINKKKEKDSNQAQQCQWSDDHVHFESLGSVDDQITEPPSGGEKLTDDHTDKRQTDVDLHGADD